MLQMHKWLTNWTIVLALLSAGVVANVMVSAASSDSTGDSGGTGSTSSTGDPCGNGDDNDPQTNPPEDPDAPPEKTCPTPEDPPDENDKPDTTKGDDDDDPCPPDDNTASGSGGISAMALSDVQSAAPIYYTGGIAERPVDLRLPSYGGVRFQHVRHYNQRQSPTLETVQGNNWTFSYWAYLKAGTGSVINYFKDAHRTYSYTVSSDATFCWEDNMRIRSRLMHNHPKDDAHTYRLQKPDGVLWIFHDLTNNWDPSVKGKLWKIVGRYNKTLTLTWDTSVEQLDYVDDPAGHRIEYTYFTSGTNNGQLQKIEAYVNTTENDANRLVRITYSYFDQTDGSIDSSCGSDNDLIQVKVETRATNDDDSLKIERNTHYRYWTGGYDVDSNPGTDSQLRMIMRSRGCARFLADGGRGALVSATWANINAYATNLFEFDSSSRVRKETVNQGGGSCCGGGGMDGEYSYTYDTHSPSDRDDWALQTKETRPDDSVFYVETNEFGETIFTALYEDDGNNAALHRFRQWDRDSTSGKIKHAYLNSSIDDYDRTHVASPYITHENNGIVLLYTYENSTSLYRHHSTRRLTYAEATDGTADTSQGAMVVAKTWAASPGGWTYRANVYLTEVYEYPSSVTSESDGSRVLAKKFDYLYHPDAGDLDGDANSTEDTDMIRCVRTSLPAVPNAQNGANATDYEYSYFYTDGYQRWHKRADGHIDYYTYDTRCGRVGMHIIDVYTSTSEGAISPAMITDEGTRPANLQDWSGAAPVSGGGDAYAFSFQNSGSAGDYVRLNYRTDHDTLGRTRSTTAPDDQVAYIAYMNNETRFYPAWNSGTDKPGLPMSRSITQYASDGQTYSTYQHVADGSGVTFSDPPTGAETWPSQTTYVSMSKAVFDTKEQMTESDRWVDIPSSTDGSAGTNYYATKFKYTTGSAFTAVEVITPPDGGGSTSGWTKTVRNIAGQVIAVYKAVDDSDPPAAYTLVREMFYGQASPGSGASLGGPLTAVKSYYGDGSNANQTRYINDARGWLKVIKPPVAPYTIIDYDNMHRSVAVATYSDDDSFVASSDTSGTTYRVSLSTVAYDNRDRVYEADTYYVDTDGTLVDLGGGRDKKLIARNFYDANNRVVVFDPSNGGLKIFKYDGAGRRTETWSCSEMEHTSSTVYSAGVFDYANSDIKIVDKSVVTFDSNSNPTKVVHREVNHDDTNGMASDSSDNVVTYSYLFYDAFGRQSGTAYYGTNDSDGWENGSDPAPGSLPSRSDTVLVTSYTYDSASGRLATVTDPKAIATDYAYDDLSQVTSVTENSSGVNRITSYTYDKLGDVQLISAANGGSPTQETEYFREDPIDRSWVTKIEFPDPTTGAASSATADKQIVTYDVDGKVHDFLDQKQSTHTFTYDALDRLTLDSVANGTGVDNSVLSVQYTFDDAGRLIGVTSYSTDDASGTPINDVAFTFDGFGQALTDVQSHSGVVGGGTPSVGYTYKHSGSSDESSSQNYYELMERVTFPNGRIVWYEAAHETGGISTIDGLLSRIGQIADDNSGSMGKVFAEYDFNGLDRMVQRNHVDLGGTGGKVGNKTALRFIRQGSSGKVYRFDRFGRDDEHRIVNYNGTTVGSTGVTTPVRFNSGYDRNSNRTFAETAHNKAVSHVYTYDNLNRATNDQAGFYSSGSITNEWSVPGEDAWTLDKLGNWTAIDRKTDGSSASESRDPNATNEYKTITYAAQTPREDVNDTIADNDIVNWSTAEPTTTLWSAALGQLKCDIIGTYTNGPDTGQGSILWLQGNYQDVRLSADVILSSIAGNGGIVFGGQSTTNFCVLIASEASGTYKLYSVSGTTWTLRASGGVVSGSGGTFPIWVEVRNGSAVTSISGVAADFTIPAGKIGVWAASGSANVKIDNFVCKSLKADRYVDGNFTEDYGNVRENAGTLEFYNTDGTRRQTVLRSVRMSTGVVQAKVTPIAGIDCGLIVNYQDPENFGVAFLDSTGGTAYTARYVEFVDGKQQATRASGSSFTIAGSTQVTLKAVMTGSVGSRTIEIFVAGTSRLSATGTYDDTWGGGCVGMFRETSSTTTTLVWDDFKCGIDNNADGDVDDTGTDYVWADYNFASLQKTLTHDDNGNTTNDGQFKYTFDAWNRLVGVWYAGGDTSVSGQRVATYAYDGLGRRTKKIRASSGDGVVYKSDSGATGIPAGDTTEHYYYAGWTIAEVRNGSDQTLYQVVRGTQYVDECVRIDRNTDPGSDNDCLEGGGSAVYYCHQDANYRMVALTDSSGDVVERYDYDAYGSPTVLMGGSSEAGNGMLVSSVGNPFMHQGLFLEPETKTYQNRFRQYSPRLGRFLTRDPAGYVDGMNLYLYLGDSPLARVDSSGLGWVCCKDTAAPSGGSGSWRNCNSPTQCPTQKATCCSSHDGPSMGGSRGWTSKNVPADSSQCGALPAGVNRQEEERKKHAQETKDKHDAEYKTCMTECKSNPAVWTGGDPAKYMCTTGAGVVGAARAAGIAEKCKMAAGAGRQAAIGGTGLAVGGIGLGLYLVDVWYACHTFCSL